MRTSQCALVSPSTKNRQVASQIIRAWGSLLLFSNDVPARQPSLEPQQIPVNEAERFRYSGNLGDNTLSVVALPSDEVLASLRIQ